jgi:hypothetical protein
MQKWEYLFVEITPGSSRERLNVVASGGQDLGTVDQTTVSDIFNRFGDDGWEMVNCDPIVGSQNVWRVAHIAAVFKRPKAEG